MIVGKNLTLDVTEQADKALAFLKALASEPRLAILAFLDDRVVNVNEIAGALGMSPSSATNHIRILEDTGLIRTEVKPASHGLQKLCARTFDHLLIQLPQTRHHTHKILTVPMPIGAYSDFQATPTCGLASEHRIIGIMDNPNSFYEPERIHAELIWFRTGYLEYRFPNNLPSGAVLHNLELSMEVCSEAPLHHPDWPSDITLWVNDIEIGTWTSPSDFGGARGQLTPEWWEEKDTQYGVLKTWKVSDNGAFIDGVKLSSTLLAHLNIRAQPFIRVRIGIKPDAYNVGGINIFGEKFGNYPQPIVLRMDYTMAPEMGNNSERRANHLKTEG